MSMDYYTYMYSRNDTNEIFYVGKGKGNRAYSKDKRNAYWKNIVNKCGYTVHILAHFRTEKEAYDHETFLIRCFRDLSACMTNICDDNRPPKNYGNKFATVLKGRKRPAHSVLMTGENNPFYGKHHTEETKQAHSQHMKGRLAGEKNPNYGNHMTLTCPHCDKTGGRMMLRWHFGNCRNKTD